MLTGRPLTCSMPLPAAVLTPLMATGAAGVYANLDFHSLRDSTAAAGARGACWGSVLYMHCSAGVYADLDLHSLKDSTALLQGHEVLLSALVPHEFAQMLPDAWLASAHAGHPFWLFCVKEIVERAKACALAFPMGLIACEDCGKALHLHRRR